MSGRDLEAAWALGGAVALAARVDVVVVVDVLSYGTSVEVALSRSAVIIPADSRAPELPVFARRKGALDVSDILPLLRDGEFRSLTPR